MVDKKGNRVFLSRNYRLIVAPRKFDVLKTNICPKCEASRANMLSYQISKGQLSADSSATETVYFLNSACPRKIPGWIVVVRKNVAAHRRAYRK